MKKISRKILVLTLAILMMISSITALGGGLISFAATSTMTSTGPITKIDVHSDGTWGLFTGISQQAQYYSGNAAAFHVWVDGECIYAPADVPAGGDAELNKGGEAAVSAVSGTGTKTDPYVITRTWSLQKSGSPCMDLTETFKYVTGDIYYSHNWSMENTSGAEIYNVRLTVGVDVKFAGIDSGYSSYNADMYAVVAASGTADDSPAMSFWADPATPPSYHIAAKYSAIWSGLKNGFNDYVNSDFIDNGYGLQWNKSQIAVGGTWNVLAYEGVGAKDALANIATLTAPSVAHPAQAGTQVTYTFYFKSGDNASYNDLPFAATSANGYTVTVSPALSDLSESPIQAVTVTVTIPDDVADGTEDTLTLTCGDDFSATFDYTVGDKETTTAVVTSSDATPDFGEEITLTATVFGDVLSDGAEGTVEFFDGETSLGTGTLVNGVATLDISTLSVGEHTITVVYGGDSLHEGSTSDEITVTVAKADTTTVLATSHSAPTYGQTVTLTATVTGENGGAVTGTVTFYDGATSIGTGTLNASGVATMTTSTLSVGAHSITAVYGGDSSNNTSTSAVVTVTPIQSNTTTALIASTTSSTYGQLITFTATVTATNSTIATGTVTFYDGETNIGTGTLNASGVATFATAALTAGSHTIKAVYAGDTSHTTSTSNNVVVTVAKATPVITVPPVMGTAFALPNRPLSGLPLVGGSASVPGTFAWATGNVGRSGYYNVTFTPTDTANYNTVIIEVYVNLLNPSLLKPAETPTPAPKPSKDASITIKGTAPSVRYLERREAKIVAPDKAITRYEMIEALYKVIDIKNAKTGKSFYDVNHGEIKLLVELFTGAGIINGYTDGTFRGENGLTRAEFVKVMSIVLGLDIADGKSTFTDTNGHWADKYIAEFVKLGYILGYPDNTFKPDQQMTRAEFVTIVNRIISKIAEPTAEAIFDDMAKDFWGFGDVMAAVIK